MLERILTRLRRAGPAVLVAAIVVAALATVLAAAPPASAYAPSAPAFDSLTVNPSAVAPGQPVSVYVLAADADGVRDGRARLESPSGRQWVDVHLHWDYLHGWLVGTFTPNRYQESGVWRVVGLTINDNEGNTADIDRSQLGAGFALTGSGSPDLTAPAMSGARVVPTKVPTGQPFTFEASFTDSGSGVAGGEVWISFVDSAGETVYDRAKLVRVDGDVWRAEFIAPLAPAPDRRVTVSNISVWDAAGVHLDLEAGDINLSVGLTAPALSAPEGVADDQIDLFYGHPLPFADWTERDLTRLGELYTLERSDPAAAGAALIDEIQDLSEALADVEGDLFTPARPAGLRLASPGATGRALALAGALRGRLALYGMLTGASDLTYADVVAWAEPAAALEPDMGPQLVERDLYRTYGPALTDLIARGLAESGIPDALYAGQHYARPGWNDDLLPDNVVWIAPYRFANDIAGYHGGAEGDVYIGLDQWALDRPLETIDTAVHELGHHIHSVLLGEPDSPGWTEYLALRGVPRGGDVGAGHDGQREEAFAADIVQAYAPPAVVNGTEYSSAFPGPDEVPQLAASIRAFVDRKLAQGLPGPFRLTNPGRELALTAAPEFTVQGLARPGERVTLWLTDDLAGLLRGTYYGDSWEVTAGPDGRFEAPLNLPGSGLYIVQAEVRRGGSKYVETAFIVCTDRRPLRATWRVPAATPLSQLAVTGTAPAGAAVSVNGVAGTAGADGTFALTVPLKPGPNALTLTIAAADGRRRTLAADVVCSPYSALALDPLPTAVRTASITVSGVAPARSAVVISGGAALVTAQAGADGHFSAPVQLNPGPNVLTFHTWGPETVRATVTYDPQATLTLNVPAATNRARLVVSGQAEPGAQVTVNGQPTPVNADGGFVVVVKPSAGGTAVTVAMTDAAGNSASAAQTVTLTGPPPAQATLKDLAGHWSRGEVERLIELGVVDGLPGGIFAPDRPITRAEFVKMLAVATGLSPAAAAYPAAAPGATGLGAERTPFIDIGGHWANGYIQAAVKAGFVVPADYAEGRFDPDGAISRREIAVMAVRALGLAQAAERSGGAAPFVDAAAIGPDWEGYAVVAQAQGIVNGLPGGVFAPGQPATRAEAAAIINRVLGKLER